MEGDCYAPRLIMYLMSLIHYYLIYYHVRQVLYSLMYLMPCLEINDHVPRVLILRACD